MAGRTEPREIKNALKTFLIGYLKEAMKLKCACGRIIRIKRIMKTE